jgi:hypothetical protein
MNSGVEIRLDAYLRGRRGRHGIREVGLRMCRGDVDRSGHHCGQYKSFEARSWQDLEYKHGWQAEIPSWSFGKLYSTRRCFHGLAKTLQPGLTMTRQPSRAAFSAPKAEGASARI